MSISILKKNKLNVTITKAIIKYIALPNRAKNPDNINAMREIIIPTPDTKLIGITTTDITTEAAPINVSAFSVTNEFSESL